MLKDGITATFGAVSEPYLHSFPKPKDFFTELYRRYCLVEAFYRTADEFATGLEDRMSGDRRPVGPAPAPVEHREVPAPDEEAREGWLHRVLRRLRGG